MENDLPFLLRSSPYFSRLVLLFAVGLFVRIALRSLLHPVDTAVGSQTLLQSGFAVTMHQVAFGAFPLCVALLASANL